MLETICLAESHQHASTSWLDTVGGSIQLRSLNGKWRFFDTLMKLNIYTPTSDLQKANIPYMLVLLVPNWHAKNHMYKLVWSIWRYGIHIWPNLNEDAGSDNWLQSASSAIHVQDFFYLICEVGQVHQKNFQKQPSLCSGRFVFSSNPATESQTRKTSNLSEHSFSCPLEF